MSDMKAIVRKYFSLVDERLFERFDEIFHADVVYERPGYETIIGLQALIAFYRNRRIIASGSHHIEDLIIDGQICVCWGRFRGLSHDNQAIDERFADVYFIRENLIEKRVTYFYRPAV